ncbi:MAG: type II secretion system F family protein [Planctomycetota bacterium]|jgi:type II secretory pathway component PulF
MILTYQAIDNKGDRTSNIIEANSEREATEMLRSQGLFVTEIAEKRSVTADEKSASASDQSKIPLKTLTLITRQMAMLLNSGSSVVPALSAIRKQLNHPVARAVLAQIISDLEEGVPLTDSLRRYPRTFDAVYCAIIAAGEASGNLAEMFERLATIVQQKKAMRNKIIGALTYPILLIVMSFKILLVLLLFVLPRFSDMFVQLAIEPPASTKILLKTGAILRDHWLILTICAILAMAGSLFVVFSDQGKRWFSNIQLGIPFVGRLRCKLIQAQIFRTMGTLLNSRVGLMDTLELARCATSNKHFQGLFHQLEDAVTSGSEPSSAFESSKLIESYICQAIRTGEQSGNLGTALIYCADILDETNAEMVNTMARLLEPIILIGMGLIVGGVAVSLFLPLFEMTAAIK